MQGRRKTFRIEATSGFSARRAAEADQEAATLHHEIMAELKALRSLVVPQEVVTQKTIEAYKSQIEEAAKLKAELDIISDAIEKTKKEIATLHVTGFEGPEMKRVSHELDAILSGTE